MLKLSVILLIVNHAIALNILSLLPQPANSHMRALLPIVKGLAQKGHNVTSVSYFPLKEPIANYTDLPLGTEQDIFIGFVNLDVMLARTRLQKTILPIYGLYGLAKEACSKFYESETFKILRDRYRPGDFDLVLLELFNTDCFLPLAKKFDVPIVGLSSSAIMPWYNERFGNPSEVAYIPNMLLSFSVDMTFLERVQNLLAGTIYNLVYSNIFNAHNDEIANKYLGKVKSIDELKTDFSLILLNTHFTYYNRRPNVPQVIEIGGVHLQEPKKLSKDLEKWINGSEHGVIYFSLGSMIKGHTLPEEKRKAFLNAFARLPQRVVWKWENETMPDKPHNVLIKKWMPQSDILAHPNIKAFISHGGLLGTIEAVNYGVPVVVMPQFGDQHTNAKALEKNGGGVILELADVTEETVYNALTTVLDPNFKKQAEELSARFRDRPLPPLETAIYWVEYVARHKGAHHMKTAAVGMPFYKYYLLDVFAFLTAVLAIHLYLAFVPIRFVVRKIRGCKKDAQKTKEKKQ